MLTTVCYGEIKPCQKFSEKVSGRPRYTWIRAVRHLLINNDDVILFLNGLQRAANIYQVESLTGHGKCESGPANVYERGVTPQDRFPDGGVKQKRQTGVPLVLALTAAVVWLSNSRSKLVVTADALLGVPDDPLLKIDSPHVRLEEIERARKTQYKSLGRNPFSPVQAPPQIPRPKPEIPGPQLPPPTPPAPPPALPSNLKFFGFGTVPNGTPRRASFTDGEEVYVLGEGEVLLNRYRLLRIGNANLEFEEISSGRTGTAPLAEEQPRGKS